ncbi:MAG: hypothetical protein UY07_C0002G0015 [Parcubacteria group bacterium GW2011_GWA1_47_8]|nr:MAG: hypothetical protein UY07_C0002G0015 [Parcubacteria group bacterium GW2011_GWA1_47_8]
MYGDRNNCHKTHGRVCENDPLLVRPIFEKWGAAP